ncbi:MAG: YqeG family HAD IIIA-type phosphatase [Candidatus Sericytochromatia bacterium]|nr:YqeG family HAD IIIA-type phosphatase [Candidatus Sericytochromatia bacterium]
MSDLLFLYHERRRGLSQKIFVESSFRKSWLRPDLRVGHVSDINLDVISSKGIRGFIFDLDDTLVHAMNATADPAIADWIDQLRGRFAIYVVSNNFSERRVAVASEDLRLPFFAKAGKPRRRFFRSALREMQLLPEQVAIVGDQLFTDIVGGNRLGAFTILVEPLSKETRWYRRWMRFVENIVLDTKNNPGPGHPSPDDGASSHHSPRRSSHRSPLGGPP